MFIHINIITSNKAHFEFEIMNSFRILIKFTENCMNLNKFECKEMYNL